MEDWFEKAPSCPVCGSEDTVPIVYGLPTEETMEYARRGKVVLGGCIIHESSPAWHCNSCGYEWGKYEEFYEEDEEED